MPYTSRNGHMFSFLNDKGSMALRLSADDRDAFLSRYRSTLAEQHGRVMREFVVVPDDLLDRTAELEPWFRRSHEWIGSLAAPSWGTAAAVNEYVATDISADSSGWHRALASHACPPGAPA